MADFASKLTPDSKKLKGENNAEDREDRLSELPEELLLFILSLLTITEAAKTSVLTRRWKMIWNNFIPRNLNFDGSKIMELEEDYRKSYLIRNKVIALETLKFVNWVKQVLKCYQQAPADAIDELKIRFDLDETYSRDIDGWVTFALEKKVKNFELDFSYRLWSRQRCYPFPPLNISTVNRLQLRSRTLGFPRSGSLTSLALTRVKVTGEVLEYIISNCLFLERLSVVFSESLVHLNVTGPSLRLKYLEISHCDSLRRLQISATNLVSFKYLGENRLMSSQINVPNLVELCIEVEKLKNFVYGNFLLPSASISQIQKLKLIVQMSSWDLKKLKNIQFPCSSHLKELELRVLAKDDNASLLGFSYLINAFPSLSKLTLQLHWMEMYNPKPRREAEKAAKSPHSRLKVVEVFGFAGQTIDTEFCMYLIENAVMLEKITIDPRKPTLNLLQSQRWKRISDEEKMIKAARECAEQLKTEYCLRDKLLIL